MERLQCSAGTWLIGAVALLLAASPLAGQAYGDHEQVLTIGAGAFAGGDGTNVLDPDGYARNPIDIFTIYDRATLLLPEGAELMQLCLYSDDRNVASSHTQAFLRAAKLVPAGGGGPFVLTVPNTTLDTVPGAGFASYCTGPLSYTIQSVMDVDGDGTPDSVAYFLDVQLPSGGRYGGMTVSWKRQVSPAPATPTFADVPPADGAFQYVEALVASGITAGCGAGNYCPGATLTRRQMAVFLTKALGLYWPN